MVETITVQPQDHFKVAREFIGRVEPQRMSEIGFELGGKINTLQVEEGQQVKAGELLAQIDTKLLTAQRAEASASLKQIQADIELARITLQRIERARALEAVSQQQLDDAKQQLESLQAQFSAAEAALNVIDVRLAKSDLRAPFDAIVVKRHLDEGQVVAAGTAVFQLMEWGQLEARIAVAGVAVDALREGSDYSLIIHEKAIPAVVRTILPIRDRKTRSVDVIFELGGEPDAFRSGDLAKLNIPRTMQKQGFWVPLEALTESTRGLWAIYTLDEVSGSEARLAKTNVELLYYNGTQAFVRGGLTDKAMIVATGLHRIVPGQLVNFSTSPAPQRVTQVTPQNDLKQ